MAQTIRSIKAKITLTNISSGAPGRDPNRLDWVKDWDGDGVVIKEQKIALPSVFAGTIEENEKGEKGLVGIALGKNVFEENPYAVGLAAYNAEEEPTIKIMTNGSAVFGREEGRQLLVRTNGSIVTPKIKVTDLDPEFIPKLDLSYNISLPAMLYASNNRILNVGKDPQEFHFRVTLAKDSHLMGHFVMSGCAEEDTEVTVNLKINNTYAPFCPLVQTVKAGEFIFVAPCAFSFVPQGVNYAFVELSSSKGKVKVGLYDMEFSLEGKYMLEATSVKTPHAEVEQTYYPIYIDYGFDSVNANITNALIDEVDSADIINVTRNLVEETYEAIKIDTEIPIIKLKDIEVEMSANAVEAKEEIGRFNSQGTPIVLKGEIATSKFNQDGTSPIELPLIIEGKMTEVFRIEREDTLTFDKYSNIEGVNEIIRNITKQSLTIEPQSEEFSIGEQGTINEIDFVKKEGYCFAGVETNYKES